MSVWSAKIMEYRIRVGESRRRSNIEFTGTIVKSRAKMHASPGIDLESLSI